LKKFIYLLLIFLTTNVCFSQTNIWGLYLNQDGAYRQLDLRPDYTYTFYHQGPCGHIPAFSDTGIFAIIGDTIFLKSHDKSQVTEKYLFISSLVKEDKKFGLWGTGTLARIFKSDSILPTNQGGRLSDNEALFLGSYIKRQGYYNNGNLIFKTETFDKIKIITNYYSSGKVKSIEQYFNDKKSGDWYFYKENGQIEKIETYKRDKLKRQNKNSL
jgi:hypothetical protein